MIFFFSSRRRHTRCSRDWSSDVCSSDLFLRSLRILRDAVSLGGVESLACHPRTTTHSELSPEDLELAGITDGLVRISVGVEDWRDLQRDIREALDVLRIPPGWAATSV